MDVTDQYIRPILEETLRLKAKRNLPSDRGDNTETHLDETGGDTLLDHLALFTD
ncbi:hypothetical protein FRC06_007217, partial [Ceratobasidium sp. 370]